MKTKIFDKELIYSIIVYLVVCTFLAVVNYFTSPYPWVLWVIGGWGLSLILKTIKRMMVLTVAIAILSVSHGVAQEIESKIIQNNVKYSVSLPPNYEPTKSYPILYLLHGYGSAPSIWTGGLNVRNVLNSLVEKGEATQMIIVMPDAELCWYINGMKHRYEDFFFEEFMPYIDSQYKCSDKAIAGISMGGYGALLYSLRHPDTFSSCVAISAGVVTDIDVKYMPEDVYGIFAESFGGRTSEKWSQNNIFDLIKGAKTTTQYYIDCGDDDFLYRGNDALHTAMRDAQIKHEYRVKDGGHTMSYWIPLMPEMFKFTAVSFTK